MSPVSTRLAMTRRAIAAATIPPRPRRLLVTRDHDQNGSRLHFRARSCADFGDATGGWREQLVLHLHRLQRGERRVGGDPIAFLDVHRLQQPRHGRAQLDASAAQSRGTAIRAERALVNHGRADIVAVDVETERIVRDHGDLVALAVERDRPLASAYGLADIGGKGAVVDHEAAVVPDLHGDAAIAERYFVAHQRSASSRAARDHAGSATGATRRSPRERVASAAARAPAAKAPSERSGTRFGSHRATKSVS